MSDERFKAILDLCKWVATSVAVVVTGMIIDAGFKDREINTKEMDQYDSYLNYVTDNKLVGELLSIAEFYKTVTISDPIRKRWEAYYEVINKKYLVYQAQQQSVIDTLQRIVHDLKQNPKDTALQDQLKAANSKLEYLNIQVASVKSPEKNPQAVNIESASYFEKKGIQALAAGDLERAGEFFGKSEKAFPTYRNSYEIKRAIDAISPRYNRADEKRRKIILDSLQSKVLKIYDWKESSEQQVMLPGG